MGRAPCCDKANVKKGPWSPEEDAKLKEYIEKYGTGGNWIALPQKVGLKRCGKSCRLRWLNYLRPNIKHGDFSDEEVRIICTLFANIGSRWSIIAAQLPGRTDNDIKNYWNTKLKKTLMGFVNNTNNVPPTKSMINPTLQYQKSSHYDDHYYSNSGSHYQNSTRSLSNYSNSVMINNTPSSNNLSFQVQNHSLFGTHDCVQYHYPVKNNGNNLLMFGSGSNEGSCSTSSDGSFCYQIKQEEMGLHPRAQNINNGDDHDHMGNLNLMWGLKCSGYFGGTLSDDQDHDYQFSSPSSCVVEDVKQVISTPNCGSVGSNDFTSFFNVDENKTQENINKVMYF